MSKLIPLTAKITHNGNQYIVHSVFSSGFGYRGTKFKYDKETVSEDLTSAFTYFLITHSQPTFSDIKKFIKLHNLQMGKCWPGYIYFVYADISSNNVVCVDVEVGVCGFTRRPLFNENIFNYCTTY